MSNRCLSLLMGGLLCLGLTACGGSQSASQTTSDDLLVGDWTPAGIEISHSVYSFEDVPQLGDLYDSNHLTVLEDGTFVYMNIRYKGRLDFFLDGRIRPYLYLET